MQSHKKFPLDLLILLGWTTMTLAFVLIPFLRDTSARLILGIPMVLFIPGYVLIRALFPKKDDLEAVERIALCFGFSIAVVPLLGLLLNFTFGIRVLPVLLTLCIYTISLVFIATYRLGKVPEEERFSVQFEKVFKYLYNELDINEGIKDRFSTCMLIFSIALAISTVYFVITVPKIGERYTEFYILGSGGKADNYTTDLIYNSPTKFLVGVVNHEYTSVNYTVQVALEKEVLTDTWFSLNHNETWEQNINFVPDKEGKDMKLEFRLFKEDNFTSPYRELHLWVNITK